MALGVLIVDDEPMIAEEIALGLEFEGYSSMTATSAGEALRILQARPDLGLLLSEIRLPDEDGLALAKRALAGRGARDALGVILMAMHTMSPPCGVAACLIKPFSMRLIIDEVSRALAGIEATRFAGGHAFQMSCGAL